MSSISQIRSQAKPRALRQAGAGVASLEVRSPAAELRLELGLEASGGICGMEGGWGGGSGRSRGEAKTKKDGVCGGCGGGGG